MTAVDILNKAAELVGGDRGVDHGNMYTQFEDTAAMWSVYLGHKVSPEQVAMCIGLVKICRSKHGAKRADHYVDLAGYAGIAGALAHDTQ